MITETLLNSLKSLFSSLGAKTSDSNYAVGLFDKTNGEPKGMMGMSDLASVLGVGGKVEMLLGSNGNVYSVNIATYESVRVIGAHYSATIGIIDFTIYSNGTTPSTDTSVRGSIGGAGSGGAKIQIYKKGNEAYIKCPSGISAKIAFIGAIPTKTTLPSDATELTVSAY